MTKNKNIESILKSLPEEPGVYQHLNREGEVIYVGKAKNLKKRVSSYFVNNRTGKTEKLVSNIADIKYIVVENEQDALLLENNLIKQYQPYYNILLKDGKSYPYICITNEDYPRIYKTRNIDKKKGTYYGPYSFSNSLDYVLDVIHQLYPVRTCNLKLTEEDVNKGKYKVCLKYHIKKCCGVCENYLDIKNYNKYIEEIIKIIKGDANEISEMLEKEMIRLASELKFEEAQQIKKRYDIIENFRTKTIIVNTSITDTEVYGYKEHNNSVYISIIVVHKGSVIRGKVIEYQKKIEETKEDILGKGIYDLRNQLNSKSKTIYVPFLPEFTDDSIKTIKIPERGDPKKLLDLAIKNVEQYNLDKIKQTEKLNISQRSIKILTELQEILKLDQLPYIIESFDNSNIQGENAVAACVVFINGKPSKKDYQLFNIKTVSGIDEAASMREITYRRYSKLKESNGTLPDLIIADGGIVQMNAIAEVVYKQLDLKIPIAGLVKDDRHRTSTLLYGFPPKEVQLNQRGELFMLLTQIQDEVHRFAISFHKKIRSKSQIDSEFDDIKGIGKATTNKLLKHFKSIRRIREAKDEELVEIIGKSKTEIIKKHFQNL